MNIISEIESLNVELIREPYDILFATVGYELRARYISEELKPQAQLKFAAAFPDQKVISYYENMKWYTDHGFEIKELNSDEIQKQIIKLIEPFGNNIDKIKILIDISSMTRFWIALVIDSIRRVIIKHELQVDFIYTLAKFSPPSTLLASNDHAGPVLPSYAGWTTEPEKPPSVIAGLGYEENKALGAVEHIQATDIWTFIPSSSIKEYDSALEIANQILLESVPKARQLKYTVETPFNCFVDLESLANRCLQSGSTVILPFGPKIFTLCALLVATLHPGIGVWRVSAGKNEEPLQRVSCGKVFGLRVMFEQKHDGMIT